MPKGENVLGVAVGRGWAAAATDRQFVRIFSGSGLQVTTRWRRRRRRKSVIPCLFGLVVGLGLGLLDGFQCRRLNVGKLKKGMGKTKT